MGASEVVNHRPPSTYLPGPGHDIEHSTSGSPGVPWLWNGELNLPNGSQVATDLTYANARPLTFAQMPGHPGSFYVLRSQGPRKAWLQLVNRSDRPQQTGMAADDPGWSTTGGLVSNADHSMVAYVTADEWPAGDNGVPWKVTLINTGGSHTWTIPRGMTPELVGVGASGAVVMNMSGPYAQDARPIYVARPGGAVEPLTVSLGPPDSDTYRAASVSPTGNEVTVTFRQGDRSCWGVAFVESGAMRAYTCDGSVDPTFSSDGEIVALGNIDQPAVAGHPSYDLATIYDEETLKAIRVYSTTLAAAHGGNLEFFAPTLVWDGDKVLVPVYDSESDGPGGWTLAWLDPSGKPRYQYARSLLVPGRMTSPSPFTFAANSLRE